jgi:hypothetical protein
MSTPETTATGNGVAEQVSDHVRAEHVEINQGGAGSIEATTVSLQQGGAARVRAREMSVAQGGVAVARTDTLRLQAESSGFAIVADQATIEPGASVFMLIARNVSGDVRPVLDWRAAAAFGAAAGVVLALLRRR